MISRPTLHLDAQRTSPLAEEMRQLCDIGLTQTDVEQPRYGPLAQLVDRTDAVQIERVTHSAESEEGFRVRALRIDD